MNAAILIGVSNYRGELGPLPGCSADITAIRAALELDGRFDRIVSIVDLGSSSEMKQEFTKTVQELQREDVKELFLYFTGHGEFHDGEMYYLLNDYEPRRRRQTSLANAEVDELCRSLNPELFVKVVDACQSGVTYIKSKEGMELYLKSAQPQFNRIYFLFSSQSDQASYQGKQASYFTDSILRSATESSLENVRYKDVMSYVADDFEFLGIQTPLFVVQADFTEVFLSLSDSDKAKVRAILGANAPNTTKELDASLGLKAILLREAEKYCDEDQADEAVNLVESEFEGSVSLGELEEIFTIEVDAETRYPPNSASIGKWIEQSNEEVRYFAKATNKSETYKRLKRVSVFNQAIYGIGGTPEPEYEDAVRTVVGSYENTWDSRYNHLRITLTPIVSSASPEALYIAPIVSRTRIRLFYAFSHFEYKNWDATKRVGQLEWRTVSAPILDHAEIRRSVQDIWGEFVKFVRAPLEERWLGTASGLEPGEPFEQGQPT